MRYFVAMLSQRPPLAVTTPQPGGRNRQTYGSETATGRFAGSWYPRVDALDQAHPWQAIPEDNWRVTTKLPLSRVHDLSDFLETEGTLEENLKSVTTIAARILGAARVSVMLLSAGDPAQPKLRLAAASDVPPSDAWNQEVGVGEGISGQVLAHGQALLVKDVHRSQLAAHARRTGEGPPSLMVVPLTVSGHIIGVVNASGKVSGGPFSDEDLALFELVGGYAARTVQAIQLRNVLRSRFVQHALAEQAMESATGMAFNPAHDADSMAKILAKSFFREMTRAGFTPNNIIRAASEIISQVSDTVAKHKKRLDRGS